MKSYHWADKIANDLIHEKKKSKYVTSAGITPSGVVHIGNFRDISTSELVSESLKDKGESAELIFVWDDYDRFRKVPKGVPKEFSKYIGMPISKVPDPFGEEESYADYFKKDFLKAIKELGTEVTFISQTKEYESNKYYPLIKEAMQKRKVIANILSEFKTQGMTEEEIENYYPLQVYCTSCGRDSTKIKSYDEEDVISYICKCGHEESADISKKNIGKLSWKIDWAMRWKFLGVDFEPGGKDHATEGGSYTISSKISEEVFNHEPPYFQGYEFVGIKGISKMSSSSGTGISPKDLLEIYEPEMIRWIMARAKPKSTLTFNFGSELIRQYEEFDKLIDNHLSKSANKEEERILFFSKTSPDKEWPDNRVSFRQVASIGQISQGNFKRLKEIYDRIGQDYDEENLRTRFEKSMNWIEKYAPEMKIVLRETPNKDYYNSLSEEDKDKIKKLKDGLENNWTLEGLTSLVYSVPKTPCMTDKEKVKSQREFFKNVYQLLLNKDRGPRLPTFLLAIGKEKAEQLLSF